MLVNIGGGALDLDEVRSIDDDGMVTHKDGSQCQISNKEAVKALIEGLPKVLDWKLVVTR